MKQSNSVGTAVLGRNGVRHRRVSSARFALIGFGALSLGLFPACGDDDDSMSETGGAGGSAATKGGNSATTGGTSATLGRYVRYRRHSTRVLCADPESSVFFDFYRSVAEGRPAHDLRLPRGSRIEGIGRPRVEASFIPGCVDGMVKVPDSLSLAAMRYVTRRLGRRVGGSTGTNFIGVLEIAQRMQSEGQRGSIVTVLCDSGERYSHSYYNSQWYEKCGIDVSAADATLDAALAGAPLATTQFASR